jgi:hypothetical protein
MTQGGTDSMTRRLVSTSLAAILLLQATEASGVCPINVRDYGAKGRGMLIDGDSLYFRLALNDRSQPGAE